MAIERMEDCRMELTGKESHWDVIVVGAGLAGILTAYYLKESGKKVLVLEADKVASGQSSHVTAKITSQHNLRYSQMIEELGEDDARMYAQAHESAIREYERLIKEKDIKCQFKRCSAYLYTTGDEVLLMEEAMAAASFGIDAAFTTETELPFPITGALCFKKQAQFAPIEFVQTLAEELEIREQTKVLSVKGNKVYTEREVFTADKIVIATHYPMLQFPGFYSMRQHKERSYVLVLSGCKKIEGMYLGVEKEGLSLQQEGEYLLLGGGIKDRQSDSEKGFAFLEEKAKEYFPECKIESRRWAEDYIPHDGIPFIGRYSLFTPNLYVATGFGKWGMTSAMLAGLILRDEICGGKNRYAKVFSPQRIKWKAGMKGFFN